MIRRFFISLGLIFAITGATLIILYYQGFSRVAIKHPVFEPAPSGVILLIPLDSRPPCTDYVSALARMAGFQVLLPPSEMLDNYRQPGNTSALRGWLTQNASRADSAIISVDMLVHGGLLASRKGLGSDETAEEILTLLRTLHDQNPRLKLYAFNIIPRLIISDDPQTEKFKQPMLEWSMLQETATLFENPNDIQRLRNLELAIPAEIPERYRRLYAANHRLNQQLVALTKTGILSGLIVGQDDSAPFGLGNMERQRLENEINDHPEMQGNLFITRGTDEVALTLLGPVTRSAAQLRHKVFVHYTEAHSADVIMPYMPKPLAQTVAEKLAIIAADPTESADEADFILVVHAGSAHSLDGRLSAEAAQVRAWLEAGKNVALVDLSIDWVASQTLLPYLQRNGAPVQQLIAYAGWNTASNSVGTALTQAAMTIRGRQTEDVETALYRDITRVGFLSERVLDDWFYQKIYRHQLNEKLQKHKIDPYDLQQAHPIVASQINHQVYNAYLEYIRWGWRNRVFPLNGNLGAYVIDEMIVHSDLPWDRTFEIFIETKPIPALIIP